MDYSSRAISRLVFCRRRASFEALIPVVLLAMAAGPACLAGAGMPGPVATRPSATVEIGDIGPGAKVVLLSGDTLRILLESTPSTGYHWNLRAKALRILALESAKALPSQGSLPGAPGRESFSFHALNPGQSTVVLDYERPWEKNTPPARSFEVSVRVISKMEKGKAKVLPQGRRVAKYAGKLPCADCSGIEESLEFYATGTGKAAQGIYVERMQYEGRPVVFITAGLWKRQQGVPGNPHAVVYSVHLNSPHDWRSYQLEKGALAPLDSDGKPIRSPFNLKLREVE